MGAPWTSLKADNVSCRAARNLAEHLRQRRLRPAVSQLEVPREQLGPEDLKIKCKRPKNGGQRLKFFWGA